MKPRLHHRNPGVTVEHRRMNQMVHFVRRIRARYGVGLTLEHMDDLTISVKGQIRDEVILKKHDDTGRVILIADLGRHGVFPVVYDPITDMLATVLEWGMVHKWKAQLDRRNDERQ